MGLPKFNTKSKVIGVGLLVLITMTWFQNCSEMTFKNGLPVATKSDGNNGGLDICEPGQPCFVDETPDDGNDDGGDSLTCEHPLILNDAGDACVNPGGGDDGDDGVVDDGGSDDGDDGVVDDGGSDDGDDGVVDDGGSDDGDDGVVDDGGSDDGDSDDGQALACEAQNFTDAFLNIVSLEIQPYKLKKNGSGYQKDGQPVVIQVNAALSLNGSQVNLSDEFDAPYFTVKANLADSGHYFLGTDGSHIEMNKLTSNGESEQHPYLQAVVQNDIVQLSSPGWLGRVFPSAQHCGLLPLND